MLLSLSFEKGGFQMWGRLILYIRVAFTCVPGFEVFPSQIIKHIYRSNVTLRTVNDPTGMIIRIFAIYLSVAFHKSPIRENSNQSRVVQMNCIRFTRVQSGTKGRDPFQAHAFLHIHHYAI